MRAHASYDAIRAILDTAEAAGLPAPMVDIAWHNASEELAGDVVRAFPERNWASRSSGGHEWIAAGGLTVFLANEAPEVSDTARADAVLAEVAVRPGSDQRNVRWSPPVALVAEETAPPVRRRCSGCASIQCGDCVGHVWEAARAERQRYQS